MDIRFILYTCLLFILFSCDDKQTDVYQTRRDNVVNVKLEKLDFGDDILMGRGTRIYVLDDFLEFSDYSSSEKMIHLLDKSTLSYVASIGDLGQGPGEIISLGQVMQNERKDKLYVSDLGHLCIYSYDIDSLKKDEDYKPYVKYHMQRDMIPTYLTFVSDTLCFATYVQYIDNKTTRRVSGKWNMKTNEVKLMDYIQPDVKNYQTNYAYSKKHNLFVEAHGRADLISIFDSSFNLKHNVYGPDWDDGDDQKLNFFPTVICNGYIISAYSGSSYRDYMLPTKLLVFKMNGDYVKTLETGCKIHFMSADEDNERLFLSLDEEFQFAYLDLKGILN